MLQDCRGHLAPPVLARDRSCPRPRHGVECVPPEWRLPLDTSLKRILRWRTPPNWSRGDWAGEVESLAVCAMVVATVEYDSSRGVPFGAFAHQRILTSVLTRFRQEWAFASRCGPQVIGDVIRREHARARREFPVVAARPAAY